MKHSRLSRLKSPWMVLLAGLLVLTCDVASAQIPFAPLKVGAPVPAALMQQFEAVSQRDIGLAPAPKIDTLKAVPHSKAGAGKPWVLYIGAEYCPYCAAMRWPLVLALMRFGSFTGLKTTRSSATDVDANTATFSFVGAAYHSQWLNLQAVETSDRVRRPLQQPTQTQLARMKRFDRPPYTDYIGSIPFMDIDDQWVQVGSPVSPTLFRGMGWYDVADQLESGQGALWQAVLGETDRLTRVFCKLSKGRPGKTCKAAGASIASR